MQKKTNYQYRKKKRAVWSPGLHFFPRGSGDSEWYDWNGNKKAY